MPAKNYAATRFSGLTEINDDNVSNLTVAFTFSTGVNKGQEAAPLVVGNTMYMVTPYPEHPLCAGPHQARRAAEMDIPAASRSRRARAWPAATWSTAARSSGRAR